MSGIKRSHENLLAEQPAASSSTRSASKQPDAPQSPDAGVEHASKKLRQLNPTVESVQEDAQGTPPSARAKVPPKVVSLKQKQAGMPEQLTKHKKLKKRLAVAKKKATAAVDEEMSDAPSSDEDREGDASPGATLDRKKAVPRKSAEKTDGATIGADEEMSGAPSSDGDGEAGSPPTQSVPAGRGTILPFTPLPPVLARQVANNKYAPSTSAAQEAYRKEVGQLLLHPQHHPMETPNSKVSEPARHAIYEHYFLGKTNEECIDTWNSYGGNANSAQAISKVLLRDTGIWFAEENAVLPYMARRNDEKAKLKKLGMKPEHFPAPHITTRAPANGNRVRNVGKSKKQPDTNASRSSAGKPSKEKATRQPNIVDANASSVGANSNRHGQGADDQDPSDSDFDNSDFSSSDDGSDSESSDDDDGDDDAWVAAKEQRAIKIAKDRGNAPPMRSLIMAATNAFGLDDNPTMALIVDDRRYEVRSDCLVKHCGFVRNSMANGQPCRDLSLSGRDPFIVRAFIQAVTPGRLEHGNRLPEYDFDFEFAHNHDLHGWDHSDPVGVVDGDRRQVRKMDWNAETCMVMYELAKDLDCNLVRNLVVDQLRILGGEEEAALRDRKTLNRPPIDLDYLDQLPLNMERRFICVLGAMHKNRMAFQGNNVQWPTTLSGAMINAIEKWIGHEDDAVSMDLRKCYCHRFHRHGARESCHIFTSDENIPTTETMISDLFFGLRNEAKKQCSEALANFDKQDPSEALAYNIIHFRGEMMQWTFRREEKIANELLQFERACECASEANPDEIDREYCERMWIKGTHYLKKLRSEHWDRWDVFERDWMLGAKMAEASRTPVDGETEPNEPLPWNGN